MGSVGSTNKRSEWRYLGALWVFGCLALGLLTWICFALQLSIATTGFGMLIVIVLLSLLDSFVSSAIFSMCGAALLNVYFTPPIFSFAIAKPQDYLPLLAFLISSLAVTSLVRRIRHAERVQRDQARLLNLTHDAIFVHLSGGHILFWNRAAESLYGWRADEAVGKVTHELLQTVFPESLEHLEKTLERDGFWEGELTHTRRDGTEVIVASRWTLQRDDQGRPHTILETNNDITHRRHAEELVRRSQAQYLAEAQRLSHTGSFGWNVDTGEVFWSEEAFRIYEVDPAVQPTIQTVLTQFHPDDRPIFDALDRRLRAGVDRFDIEHRLLFADGRTKHVRVVGHAHDQGRRQFIGALMDVTGARQTAGKLRQLEGELSRASRASALGELSASIAHEVGQPLAAIVTNGEACQRWLERTPPNIKEVISCVKEITDEANRAADIVQRVRRLMKGAPPEQLPVDVAELVQEVVVLVRTEADRNRCSLAVETGEIPLRVMGDRVQLQQVLINMAINAMQAMSVVPGRRRLEVAVVQAEGDKVVFSVRDNGPGVSEENLPRLFDAFFTTRREGMGMGLAICASIVEAHGGNIWAANNPEGGSTFSFSLPSAPAAVSA
ncbi:ATP-binding protein [Paraburkholderia guartelaensis]|uniref:ATP-binding protein n=1 Tax=Paraburkholderia guartelaensis TaxID=2546446 RepID=UPI002AB5F9E0|nr:ATP-binding protein [Paraburkholderia guartelaensis]